MRQVDGAGAYKCRVYCGYKQWMVWVRQVDGAGAYEMLSLLWEQAAGGSGEAGWRCEGIRNAEFVVGTSSGWFG